MDFAAAIAWWNNTSEYIQSHRSINTLIQFGLIMAILAILYRLAMSRRFPFLREKIPLLGLWYGKRQIRFLLQSEEYARAGEQLLALGQANQAIEVFLRGHLFGRAADVHLQKHRFDKAAILYERAGEFGKAAQIYLDRKQYDLAEKALEKADRLDELGGMYRAKGELSLAVSAYLRVENFADAVDILVEQENYSEAAKTCLQAYETALASADHTGKEGSGETTRLALKAASLYEQAKEHRKAAELYLSHQKPEDAARCLERAGEKHKAAELYEKVGHLQKASDLFQREGKAERGAHLAGEAFYREGKLSEAVSKFQEAGDFERAADIFREMDEPEKAAQMYERAKLFSAAGTLFKELERFEDAGRVFEMAGDLHEAAVCYKLGNLLEREAPLLEKLKDYVALAKNYFSRQLLPQALESLGQVTEKDSRYRSAVSFKGEIYASQDEPERAKECFEQALRMTEKLDGDDINTIYNLALVSEKTQTSLNALDVLEKSLAQDRIDPHALEKAKNVHTILTERASTRFSPKAATESAPGEATTPTTKRYKKTKEIGRGGMGIVYTALDTVLDRVVALKILPSFFKENKQAVQTFLREAKAAAALNHPNIVTVHDSGIQDGDYYIAMEFIDGNTLKEILRSRGKLSLASVQEVLRQLLSALKYAHAHNVVHRDLTTSNMMWTKQKTIKIMDFGLAKVIKELQSEQSIVGGTPSYMSPEQTVGDPIDHRTDIYSLGICLYELLLGELPFPSGDLGYHHLNTAPPIPKEKDPTLPEAYNAVILRCLEKKPADRFQAMAEIEDLLVPGR